MKKIACLFLLMLMYTFGFAQGDKHIEVLKKQQKKCNEILANFTGKPETFDELIKEADIGLKATNVSDYEFRFIFYQAIGTGYYYKQDFKLAMQNFEFAYEQAVKAGLTESSLKPLGNLVSVYHYLGLQDKADKAAQKLKNVADNVDTLKSISDIYYNLGLYNQQQKFYYSIALSNFLKSVELHKPIADTTKITKRKVDYAVKLMMVAEIYLQLKQPRKALEYLNETTPYTDLSVIVGIAAYGKFIRSYVLLNDKENALKYYNLLHSLMDKKAGKWSELVSSSVEIASLYLKEGDYKVAKLYLDKADKQSKLDNSEILTSSVNLAYGNFYKQQSDYKNASKYYKLAKKGSETYNKEQYADLLKALTEIEIKSGNQKDASIYFNRYLNISDSLNQRKIALNLAEMEAKFQNQFKQQKIGELDRDNKNKDEQLSEEKKTRWILIGGASLLIIALLSIYLNVRNTKKANRLLDEKNKQLDVVNTQLNNANQTKAKLFSIISHDLRSPVSQLFTFLRVQQNNPNLLSAQDKIIHEKKLMSTSSSLLKTMEDLLLWSKSQMEHFELETENVDLAELFEDSILFVQNQAEAKNVVIELGDLNIKQLNSDHNLLGIILRNLLQNAVNHSFSGTIIKINAVEENGNKVIAITNRGEEITPEKIQVLLGEAHIKGKSSGYGLVIVKELLEKLNGSLFISSNSGETKISILFN